MDLKFVDIRNFSKLCNSKDEKDNVPLNVEIPYYQRPYKWDSTRIKKLISDFHDNEEGEGEDGEKYFANSVVMVERSGNRFEIVDGQQRITTLFLMNYLRFILIREYIDYVIDKRSMWRIIDEMTELIETAKNLFDKNKVDKLGEIKNCIGDHLRQIDKIYNSRQYDEVDELWDKLSRYYRTALCLPIKNVSEEESYKIDCMKQNEQFLSDTELTLVYSRKSYNEKLKEALSRMVMNFTNQTRPKLDMVEFDKSLSEEKGTTQKYMNAMDIIFKALEDTYIGIEIDFEQYVSILSEAMKKILNNIEFCVVVTGNEKAAYTLFEVLNDRNFPVDDLELIKNLFFKMYCEHENDNVRADYFIEKADMMWGNIFNDADGRSSNNKKQSKLISYLAAQYFTANDGLKYNDNEKYREVIGSEYLNKKQQYDGDALLNDICIYQMLGIILEVFEIRYQKKAENVIMAERENTKSITYKALNLFNALKLYGVMPVITNIIINKFLEDVHLNKTDIDTRIKKFREYVEEIRNDSGNRNDKFKDIHNVAYEFWRFALLAYSADKPRSIAKEYIKQNNVSKAEYRLKVEIRDTDDLNEEFRRWIGAWRYGNENTQLKVKVLFINLFNTNKVENVLIFNKTGTKFPTNNIQLDHLEPDKINNAAPDRYFSPASTNMRETYTDSLGNFMIMDGESNNNKSTMPLQAALDKYKVYDYMSNHWLVQEIHEIFDDADCGIDRHVENVDGESIEVYRVPNEEFFNRRKQRLIAYFKAILSKGLNDDRVEIIKR